MPNVNNAYNWSNSGIQQIPYSSSPYGNNYMNRSYQSYNQPQQQQQFYQNNNSQNNIIWVKGKQNARTMQLAPNSTVMLLDSEVGKFYIKTTDDIGLGKLRIYNYTEEPDDNNSSSNSSSPDLDLSNYVTKTQLEEVIKEIKKNEQSIPNIESKPTNTKQQSKIVNNQF